MFWEKKDSGFGTRNFVCCLFLSCIYFIFQYTLYPIGWPKYYAYYFPQEKSETRLLLHLLVKIKKSQQLVIFQKYVFSTIRFGIFLSKLIESPESNIQPKKKKKEVEEEEEGRVSNLSMHDPPDLWSFHSNGPGLIRISQQ